MKDRSDDPSHHERTLLPRSYISLLTMKDQSDDPSHHEQTLLPRSYISLHEGSIRRPIAPQANDLTTELHLAPPTMRNQSDDPSHHHRIKTSLNLAYTHLYIDSAKSRSTDVGESELGDMTSDSMVGVDACELTRTWFCTSATGEACTTEFTVTTDRCELCCCCCCCEAASDCFNRWNKNKYRDQEMLYLTMLSTHFIYGYMALKKKKK